MIRIPEYQVINFFEWCQKNDVYFRINKYIKEKNISALQHYVALFLKESNIDINIRDATQEIINIYYDGPLSYEESTDFIPRHYKITRCRTRNLNFLEWKFTKWLIAKNISIYDVQKMPASVFNDLLKQYIKEYSSENNIHALHYMQKYYRENIFAGRTFKEIMERYNDPNIWKCIFLPRIANNILPKFIKKYYDDLNEASYNYLDIFYNKKDLMRTGHLLKREIEGFDSIPADAIPCLILWHSNICEYRYYQIMSYNMDDIYNLIMTIIRAIATYNDDNYVFKEAEKMATEISKQHLLDKPNATNTVNNITLNNSSIGNSLITGNNNSNISAVCIQNDNMFNDKISEIITKINALDELQQEQKENLSEILENLKNPEKQNESKITFKGMLMGLGSVATKIKAIIAAHPEIAEFLNLK